MNSFERAFDDTENAASSAVKSAADLTKQARQLQKAAKEGNIAAIKRSQSRLDAALTDLRQTVANAVQSWPFNDAEEKQHLEDSYTAEVRRAASEQGLDIYERDGRLVSHPSIVRIMPGERAVRIDRKKFSTIRPSYLANILLQEQQKPVRYRAQPFLEALYQVYLELTGGNSKDRLLSADPVVRLSKIYKLFTSLPGSGREYARPDFARDLYLLETSGLKETRSRYTISFHASTGTRRPRAEDLFSFVGPDGQSVQYYGVRFTRSD